LSGGEEFSGIIGLLRFFADSGRVNVLDRLGFAQSPVAVREALYEAIRTARVLAADTVRVRIAVKTKDGEEKVGEFACADYDIADDEKGLRGCMGVKGRVEGSSDPSRVPPGKYICCYLPPKIPSEDELKRFFSILEEDPVKGLTLAKELASLAFTRRWSG